MDPIDWMIFLRNPTHNDCQIEEQHSSDESFFLTGLLSSAGCCGGIPSVSPSSGEFATSGGLNGAKPRAHGLLSPSAMWLSACHERSGCLLPSIEEPMGCDQALNRCLGHLQPASNFSVPKRQTV